MTDKTLIQQQINKLQEELKVIEESEKAKDFQSIIYNEKEFRIYKWENKPFKDFPMPEGFKWCPYFEFVELVNKEKFKAEEYPIYYYSWNPFELNHKNKYWELARAYLNGDGYWVSYGGNLASSYDNGRVVVRALVSSAEQKVKI